MSPPLSVGVLFTSKSVTCAMIKAMLDSLECEARTEFFLVVGIDENADTPSIPEEWQTKVFFCSLTHKTRTAEGIFKACAAWDELGVMAFQHGADVIVFLGPDVDILSPSWYASLCDEFTCLQRETNAPYTLGCVCLRDEGGPGWPSFPVIGRAHWETFGYIVPSCFINQDFDPFIYRLYADVGLARTTKTFCVHNTAWLRPTL